MSEATLQFDAEEVRGVQNQLANLKHQNGRRVRILDGLSNSQVETLEAKYSFKFPPDVKFFLQIGVPINISSNEVRNSLRLSDTPHFPDSS
mmetsp:Transcript_45878/g.71880  ORF Transcript_45878/g.71880 Transcript_45878/m.71880 type:complete len:91 (+) Transcript_45878:92-364(+)